MEFGGLGLGRAGHAGQLPVHAEVVLDGDGRVGLVLGLERDAFLRFDRLVQAVRPAPSLHDASGVLVDDLHLAVLDHVLLVGLVERVGLEQLADGVDLLRDADVGGLGLGAQLGATFGRQGGVAVQLDKARREVGQHEGVEVAGAQRVASHLGEVGLVVAFVDREVEALLEVEAAVLLDFGGQHALVTLEQLHQPAVLLEAEQAGVAGDAVRGQPELVHRVLGGLGAFGELAEFRAEFGEQAVDQLLLQVHQLGDVVPQAGVGRLALLGDRAGDDQRRAGLVDEHGVDLVDDAEVVVALDLLLGREGHAVVAQVVEAELRGGAVGDVAAVGGLALIAAHLVLDAADRQPEPFEQVPHPLGVAAGEVVVDRDELAVAAREGVQVQGQGGDEGLALARGHLGDLALVEGDAADELDVEMDHLPDLFMLADDLAGPAEASGGVLDGGEGLGKQCVQGFALGVTGPELGRLGPKGVVGEPSVLLLDGVDPAHDRGAIPQELPVMAAGE